MKIHRRGKRRLGGRFRDRRLFPHRVNEELLEKWNLALWKNEETLYSRVGTRKWTNVRACKCLHIVLPWAVWVYVCLPAMFMLIGSLLRFPKLACPSPFLLLYVRGMILSEETKESSSRDHRGSWRCQETAASHLPVNHWDLRRFGGFGSEELRDGVK